MRRDSAQVVFSSELVSWVARDAGSRSARTILGPCGGVVLLPSPGGGTPGLFGRRLGLPDDLVREEDDVALDGLGVDEAHRFLVAGLAEETLAGPEHDREDLQPQLVDQVVLHQRAYELEAAGHDDFPVELVLQRRDRVHRVALEYRRVVPVGILEGRGHDIFGQAVQPVRQLATPGWPPRGEPLVAPPTQQQGISVQPLVERELVELWAVLDQSAPAAEPEAFV